MDARARLAEAAEDWDKAQNAYTEERAKYVAVAAPKVLDARGTGRHPLVAVRSRGGSDLECPSRTAA